MDDDEAGDTYNMDGDDLYGDDMYDDLYNAPTEAKTVSEAADGVPSEAPESTAEPTEASETQFEKDEKSETTAITRTGLDKYVFGPHYRLTPKQMRTSPERRPMPAEDYHTVYIQGIRWHTTDQQLEDAFKTLGVTDFAQHRFIEDKNNGKCLSAVLCDFNSSESAEIVVNKLGEISFSGVSDPVTCTILSTEQTNQLLAVSKRNQPGVEKLGPHRRGVGAPPFDGPRPFNPMIRGRGRGRGEDRGRGGFRGGFRGPGPDWDDRFDGDGFPHQRGHPGQRGRGTSWGGPPRGGGPRGPPRGYDHFHDGPPPDEFYDSAGGRDYPPPMVHNRQPPNSRDNMRENGRDNARDNIRDSRGRGPPEGRNGPDFEEEGNHDRRGRGGRGGPMESRRGDDHEDDRRPANWDPSERRNSRTDMPSDSHTDDLSVRQPKRRGRSSTRDYEDFDLSPKPHSHSHTHRSSKRTGSHRDSKGHKDKRDRDSAGTDLNGKHGRDRAGGQVHEGMGVFLGGGAGGGPRSGRRRSSRGEGEGRSRSKDKRQKRSKQR